jgi:hypothetical protein
MVEILSLCGSTIKTTNWMRITTRIGKIAVTVQPDLKNVLRAIEGLEETKKEAVNGEDNLM